MMERLVDQVVALEAQSDVVDRIILALGIFSMALAVSGTVLLYV